MTETTQFMFLHGNQSSFSGSPFSVHICTFHTGAIYGKKKEGMLIS